MKGRTGLALSLQLIALIALSSLRRSSAFLPTKTLSQLRGAWLRGQGCPGVGLSGRGWQTAETRREPFTSTLRLSRDGDQKPGRRELIASVLSPVAAVSTAYLLVPAVLSRSTRSSGWYKKMFAQNMESMDDYEEGVSGMKRTLFGLIQDNQEVLEIGAGLGPNLPYFPSSVRYTAVEPNEFMHDKLRRNSERFLKNSMNLVDDIRMVPSASVDVVVSTLVLCSVQDQGEMLDEILRVLRPGGIFLFLEHVIERSQGYPTPYNQKSFNWSRAWYRWFQRAITPLQVALADGCHADRDTLAAMQTKFSDVYCKHFYIPELWGGSDWWSFFPIGPQIAGVAIKRPLKDSGILAKIQFQFCAAQDESTSDDAVSRKVRCD